MKRQKQKNGFVMTAVLMLIVIASLIGGAFLISAHNSFSAVDHWQAYDECLMGLQSGLESRKYTIDQAFRTNYNDTHSWDSFDELTAFDGAVAQEYWTNEFSVSPQVIMCTVSTLVSAVTRDTSNYTANVTITNVAWATHEGITRRVREVVTYRYASAPEVGGGGGDGTVFDNVFFIDNVGFFSGVNADFNGDVRANMDIDLQYSSIRLNGDAYAAGENTSHKLYKNLAWDVYGEQSFAGTNFAERARPAEYTDYNRGNTNTYWPQGYDEVVNFYDGVDVKDMPFVGPLDEYMDYAVAAGGVASDASTTVNAVWGDDPGENAGIGTNDNGCLILIGTEANPINLSGIVVAKGDIYIKGYYTGQGTLYAGRNVYVLGNVRAVDPPTWPKPDGTPLVTAEANKTKDFLGLCAKGSLLFGDHTAYDTSLLKEPHTASHATDASDAALGYVSYYASGIPYFHGDYTLVDGDGAALRSDGTPRHFFEPMISDAAIAALGVSASVSWMDAALYANHLIAGEFANAVLNGSFVCRDEAIKREGNLVLNWDIRLGSRSLDGMGFAPWLPGMLPRQTTIYRTVQWTELAP